MKFFVSLIVMALLAFAASLFLPWWSIAIAAFLVSLFVAQTPAKSFLAGFVSLFLLWGLLSFWISYKNEHLLAHKVSVLIIKADSPYMLMFITALIGGLVAGLAALSASFARPAKRVQH